MTINFTAKLHSTFGDGNLFYSPFSLLSALGMCAAGAKGRTKSDFSKVLESPQNPQESNAYFKNLITEVVGDGSERLYELISANALWVQNNLELNQEYQKTIVDDYNGVLTPVDYNANPDGAVEKINSWCNENTRGKIPTIINRDFINKDTLLILTNAIYFLGKWKKAFDEKNTQNKPFDGVKTLIPMMTQTSGFPYAEHAKFQALEMDYQGDDLSMVVVLPNEGSFGEVENDLESSYTFAIENLRHEEVVISFPKFEMETSYVMTNQLIEMGLGLAFSDEADFSEITKEERLKISGVVHKAFVKCDEEGTEAAAATAIGMMRCTSMRVPVQPKIFNANHPFLFFIRNNNSNAVLFAGRFLG